jgi:hypothetical protein
MLISYIIDAFKDLATLIGLPFFTVLLAFFILIVELFVFGVLVLFAVWRMRKEMIDINRKIELLAKPPEKKPEKETTKEFEKKPEREIEEAPEKESEKKKYRYRWK